MTGFDNMQKDIFSNYEMWHLSHAGNNGLSVCTADGNISIDSLLDETSCTDLLLCNIIL